MITGKKMYAILIDFFRFIIVRHHVAKGYRSFLPRRRSPGSSQGSKEERKKEKVVEN
jgi:hypothetical protein